MYMRGTSGTFSVSSSECMLCIFLVNIDQANDSDKENMGNETASIMPVAQNSQLHRYW